MSRDNTKKYNSKRIFILMVRKGDVNTKLYYPTFYIRTIYVHFSLPTMRMKMPVLVNL